VGKVSFGQRPGVFIGALPGVRNAEEKQTKVRLAVAINHIIQGRKLSQTAAARRLKVN
jgi:predicted XRE-type DNA-binding protein